MRLNHLKISGFKSFPERVELAFDDGVTAIVGPNGCGKSNVIDAITWVLGEQSARSLRGERMEDVIFSGSDARRPTAAAEVRLQLSEVTAALARLIGPRSNGHSRTRSAANGDGHGNGQAVQTSSAHRAEAKSRETQVAGSDLAVDLNDDDLDALPTIARDVEVSRRLFRSGESEYLIDGQVCRLRDIQDLLMDSGVGIKAYAVIEQGRIGQILGARPLERRQLLEEAAGVTKYKSRRHAAELKLEAAQQNLTRVDDVVFEVEKQRSALKRQASRARRYRRLREELRRWEKVLFARKSVSLTLSITDAEHRLEASRVRERDAAVQLANLESTEQRMRIELSESDQQATKVRDAAHSRELEVGRHQQQVEFDTQRVETLEEALRDGKEQLCALEARRGPLRDELTKQSDARDRCDAELDVAADRLRAAETGWNDAQRVIEGLEANVEASRDEVFASIQSASTLRYVIDNATAERGRIAGELEKLRSEGSDVAQQLEKISTDRSSTDASAGRVRSALKETRLGLSDRDAELASARIEHEWRMREVRTRDHNLAALSARLLSLEELDAARAGYTEAARLLLAQSTIKHCGSVADHLEVDRKHERAVEACLSELMQCIVVRQQRDAVAGMELVQKKNAGRCGFLIMEESTSQESVQAPPDPGLTSLNELVQVKGPGEAAVRSLLAYRWMAPSLDTAIAAARTTTDPIVTPEGVVLRGASVQYGSGKREALGILATKGEMKELQKKMVSEKEAVDRLNDEIASFAGVVTRAEEALSDLQVEEHKAEKELIGLELKLARLDEEMTRLLQTRDVIETDQRQAEEQQDNLDAKQVEAHESIARLESEQHDADERFNASQHRFLEARESLDELSQRVTNAKADHAAFTERSSALASDVTRLEEVVEDLAQRLTMRATEDGRTRTEHSRLLTSITETEQRLHLDVKTFKSLSNDVRVIGNRSGDLRDQIDTQDNKVQEARQTLETQKAEVGQLEVTRATAVADLSYLETSCTETFELSIEQVQDEVAQFERDKTLVLDPKLIGHADEETEPESGEGGDDILAVEPAWAELEPSATESAEQVIGRLRTKIGRMGPVNMMAIDQFDELEERYEFLTAQRKDLLDSIQVTGEAIKRIDVTTRERFLEAFTAVNDHFQMTFSTLFGGGRAGLVLIDESDLLESGIDIIAQPPGKRLQNIQLLSGGEKALIAMALMFAIFKYKPSPFCLLDEIDAPLDDANIGRFVDMLRGMQDHTQFVLVTHNRKTMEIANCLYGVTMEEPGVSKLISVKLN